MLLLEVVTEADEYVACRIPVLSCPVLVHRPGISDGALSPEPPPRFGGVGKQSVTRNIKNLETSIFNPRRFFIVLETHQGFRKSQRNLESPIHLGLLAAFSVLPGVIVRTQF
jgi:hypothetical protein